MKNRRSCRNGNISLSPLLVSLSVILIFATSVRADIAGNWTGLDKSNFNGQLRKVSLSLSTSDQSPPGLPIAPPIYAPQHLERKIFIGQSVSSLVDTRRGNYSETTQIAGYFFPQTNVIIVYWSRGGRFQTRNPQIAVLSSDRSTIAAFHTGTARNALPYVLIKGDAAPETLNRVIGTNALAQVQGALPTNPLSILKARQQQQAAQKAQQESARAVLEASRGLQQEMVKAAQAGDHQRVAELRQQLQDIALQGIAQQSGMLPPGAPIETKPPPSGCPQNILDWTAEMEANGASQNQFSGLTQLANLFRPESFVPHFGKPFGEFSKQEAFKVARDMQLYCLKPNSPLYTSPIATSIGNAFSEHGAFARFDAASAALALETLAAWQTKISDRIDKSSTLQIADAFEIQRANLAKNLWPVENESGREFIAQSISRKASKSILQTAEQISLRIQRRDTSSLNELRALTSSELFSKLTPEQSTSTRQSLWLKIDPALDTYFASQLSDLRKQDASALLQNGKRWYQSVAQALGAISKRPPYTTFIKQFAADREAAFSKLKEDLLDRLKEVEERSTAANFGSAYAIDIDASFSPTWRELKQARLARVDEIDEKAFLARLGDGPFGPKYPGAVYLNALYRGDLARLKSEDKRLQDPLIAYMRPLLDSGIMDAFGLLASGGILQGNQLSKQMLESARQQNILDPLLAYFVVHYRSAYPNCRDAQPATIKRTRTWEDVTRWSDGSETRSPGGSSVDFIEVNHRHKAAWLSFEGDASSPESLEFFNWFGRALSPNGSDYDMSALSQALRGLKQAMGEYPCDHDVIKTLESNMLAIYEGRQPERAQYVRTSWKGDQTPDSEMNLYVSVLNALSYLDPPRNQVEANKLAKARLDPAPLFEALQSHPAKSLEELRPLLAEYLPNIDLESKNEEGLTPLLVAVFHRCDTEVVQKLIEAGADLQAADPQGNGPIHLAVVTSSATGTPTLERLIAAGADPNKANNRGYTPAHQSVGFSSDPSVIRVLAAAGADYNRPNPRGESPLYTALKFKAAEPILQALLDAGADPVIRDSNGAILANILETMPSLKPASR